jgi:benzoylformate decarboxylase
VSTPATVRAAAHDLLRSFAMTTIFGNPGSTELAFFKDLPGDFRYVLGLQEASVVAMADGFAQATGNAAFVNVHSAVGLGHGAGSLYTAMRNQAPLVITAGQQSRSLLTTEPYLFADRAAEFPQPHVKWSNEPSRAQDVPAALARAYLVAMTPPRGPTFVSVPSDDWDAPAEPGVGIAREVHTAFVAQDEALVEVATALRGAGRPALVVGPGVDRDGGWDATVALAERVGAAVWVSPLSSRCSFPEDHPQFAGFLTPHREKLAAQLAPHDVVVVLGAPVFTYHVEGTGPFVAPGTTMFQLVDDPSAAAAAPVGTAVLTTIRAGVEAVLRLMGDVVPRGARPFAGRTRRPAPPAEDPVSGAYLMSAIARLVPGDAIVVEEAPTHRNAMHDHLPITRPSSFFVGASGGLGYALPAAVGISLARPSQRVVCLLGDGSSLYSIQALWTAAQHALSMAVVLFDNRAYNALKAFGQAMGIDKPPGVDLPGLDVAAIAAGLGCPARRIERVVDVEPALVEAFEADGPCLVDVLVDPRLDALY